MRWGDEATARGKVIRDGEEEKEGEGLEEAPSNRLGAHPNKRTAEIGRTEI